MTSLQIAIKYLNSLHSSGKRIHDHDAKIVYCIRVIAKASAEAKKNSQKSKAPASSVKHGGGTVIVWTCMAATGAGSLVFINNAASNCSNINSDKCAGG